VHARRVGFLDERVTVGFVACLYSAALRAIACANDSLRLSTSLPMPGTAKQLMLPVIDAGTAVHKWRHFSAGHFTLETSNAEIASWQRWFCMCSCMCFP
jgi:hypothetical protein